MTFDQIQYFIAIAECNTYFDAAEELNISQSALSPERPFTRTPWPFAGSMRS